MTLNKLNGTECGTEIAKKINTIIDEKASVSLDNLDTDGQAIIDGKVNSSDLFDANEHIKINKLQSYSLPSNQYVDLTLGPSGSSYVAPADGWFCVRTTSTKLGESATLVADQLLVLTVISSSTAQPLRLFIPVNKNSEVLCYYDKKPSSLKFIYALGSAPQS